MINELAKPPEPYHDGNPGNKEKRQLFTSTDIAVELPPTPVPEQQQFPIQSSYMPLAPSIPPQPYPSLPDPIMQPFKPVSPSPRFPLQHPLALELERLQDTAAVIHFSAVGKPWTFEANGVEQMKPDAHPLLAEQFKVWRDTAEEVCPGGAPARWEMVTSMDVASVAAETAVASSLSYERPVAGFGVPVHTTW